MATHPLLRLENLIPLALSAGAVAFVWSQRRSTPATSTPDGSTPTGGTSSDGAIDLTTVLGVQRALAALGFPPGPLNGVWDSQTEAAVADFQRSAGLKVDGKVGTFTRRALANALARQGRTG